MMDNKFWMQVFAVIVAMLLMSWVVRPVLGGVLGLNVKEGNLNSWICSWDNSCSNGGEPSTYGQNDGKNA